MMYRSTLCSAAALMALLLTQGAQAATVTDKVTFSTNTAYNAHWSGHAASSGSFDLTFDPTKMYLNDQTTGLSNFAFSVSDPTVSSNLTFGKNVSWTYAYGILNIFTGSAADKVATNANSFVIGVNGWQGYANNPAVGIWYTQQGFNGWQTAGGRNGAYAGVSISPVPVPAALPMFGAALIGLGGLARRRAKKAV